MEQALYPLSGSAPPARADRPRHFEVDDLGIPLLSRASGDKTVVTDGFVNELREFATMDAGVPAHLVIDGESWLERIEGV